MHSLSILASLLALAVVATAEDIEVINKCGTNLWVKSEGTNAGPFMLSNGASKRLQVRPGANPTPRVWAHRGCGAGGSNCETQEGHVSLAELHWDPNPRKTWYDISQVDGYNLPITMEPFNLNSGGRCERVNCNFNLNNCPGESQVKRGDKIVACRNNNRDIPNSNYAIKMKQACPNVYSWSKDDRAGMRDCGAANSGMRVTFC